MEAFIIDPARLISDIVVYISELRNTYQSSQLPVTDDETTLHKFCVKLETVLRHEQKEKYSLLGVRKDYWNFISDCIPKDDGVKYVHAIPQQVKTPQGKGRAFIRYSLVKKSLADAIQRCLVTRKQLSSYFGPDAILCHPSLSTALVNKLYDLNDLEFDLPCAGLELDISWPAFSSVVTGKIVLVVLEETWLSPSDVCILRRSFVDGQGSVSGRRSSISSMTSFDFRNDRPDPLIGLASEVSVLKATFVEENSLGKTEHTEGGFNNVSIADSTLSETPTIADMTLEISHLHQRILKWKAGLESQLSKACSEAKKSHDDRMFVSQDYELKIKQLNERYTNLTKGVSEEMNSKVKELFVKLTTAEKALSEREAEIEKLKEEVKVSVSSSHEAQRSAIELERQITASERKQSELTSECEQLQERLRRKDEVAGESEMKLSELKEKCSKLELTETESNKRVVALQGELKAKEVVLENVQESFEKLNGIVFGSFEELESDLKSRLLDREKGLQNQSAENRKLETNIVEIQQQNKDLNNKLTNANTKIKEFENASKESQNVVQDLQTQLSSHEEKQETFLSELNETFSTSGRL
ncbi:FYVE and coiled-coil domain-containing protein 1 [Desmophyllum pertusum]|uniref:FYVE and coiled-coil domain-containing protein 1 n=1 Tax=Desmophyllum pertusum TaxID=174260 RepID=A0A9W9ZIK6_9CNID|nr:FYVE and coiled-coil domain-containing protein 1 [Desmophyllum pertusum]